MPAPDPTSAQPAGTSKSATTHADAAPRVLGTVPRLLISRQYKLGLCAVAAVMLLLPVLYLALTGAVAYGVWLFAVTHADMAESGYAYSFLLYITLLISGGLLVLLMVKPLFFKFWQKETGFELRRADAPEFHAFVAEISNALGVPPPRSIRLDLRPNAGARFQRDLFSIHSKPILVIGLPLLLTLNVRQLAGVIAHEVCHLSQHTAMRLTWLVRTVNYWLATAVYGPHVLEDYLEWSSEIGPLTPIFFTAKFFMWITRGVLWVLMIAGYSVSGYMLRQMEVDADRYAARVGGSRTFEEVQAHLELLSAALPYIDDDLSLAYDRKLMPDDLTPLVLANRDFARNAAWRWESGVELGGYHRYLRSHPPDEERIASAHRENAPGIVADEAPALSVFRDFKAVSKKFTREWYRLATNRSVETSDSAHKLLNFLGKDERSAAAYTAYFHLPPGTIRRIPLPNPLPAGKSEEIAAELKTLSADADAGAWSAANLAWREAHELYVAGTTTALLAEYVPGETTTVELTALERGAAAAEAGLQLCEARAAARMTAAFQILAQPHSAKLYALAPPADMPKLLAAAATLGALLPSVLELRRNYTAAIKVVEVLSKTQRLSRIAKRLRPRLLELREHLGRLQQGLGTCTYPFECSPENLTLRRYVLPAMPDKPDLGVLGASEHVMQHVFSLYTALLGRLALYAEPVETAIQTAPDRDYSNEIPEDNYS